MGPARILLLCGFLLPLGGCAAAGLAVVGAGAGVGIGEGVDYTMNGIAYRTFAAPMNNVRFATLKAFDRMDMPVTADQRTDKGWALSATAADRTISVELESLTPRTTRMRVVADEGQIFFKDKSTETELITQTAQMLDSQTTIVRSKPATHAETAPHVERSASQ